MKIKIQNSPLTLTAGDIPFTLQDTGSAMVTMILSIEGKEPIQHDAINKGKRTDLVRLVSGKTYTCNIYVAGYKFGSYGPGFDSVLTVNGVTIALANGNIPKGSSTARDDQDFKLIVT